ATTPVPHRWHRFRWGLRIQMFDAAQVIDRRGRTRPRSPKFHLFSDGVRRFALDVESGRIHRLPAATADVLDTQMRLGDPARAELTAMALGIGSPAPGNVHVPRSVAVKALSLS